MCDRGRASNRLYKGRASRIIHLYIIVVLFLATGSAVASAQSLQWYDQNASNNNSVYSTPTPTPTPIPASSDLTGYVKDSQGNKVPHAYVVLLQNGSWVPIQGNPEYSGVSQDDRYGQYRFTGLQPGSYTVYAEKSDVFVYNGTATIILQTDADASLDIVLKGYTFKPYITATPVPVPTLEPTILPTPEATAVPVSDDIFAKVKEKALGPVIIVFVVGIGGAGIMTVLEWRKPKNKKPNTLKPQTPQAPTNANGIPQTKKMPAQNGSTSPMGTSAEYKADIEELVKMSMATGLADISVLNRVNAMAKKHGVDQNTIFSDMKKIRGSNSKK